MFCEKCVIYSGNDNKTTKKYFVIYIATVLIDVKIPKSFERFKIYKISGM